jgi:general L-amino acid transport system substrate-binding protein
MTHLAWRAALAAVAAAALLGMTGAASAQTKTLDAVKARGAVNCGVNTGLPGFSQADEKGVWTGLDADYCRAVAAAVLGDGSKVKFVPTTAKERFTALQSGEVDLLARNTTWTSSRDSTLGLAFAGINYYDGQGFMVKKSLGVKSAKDLKGATVCVQTGTTTELNLADFFRTSKLDYKPLVFEKVEEALSAYDSNRCDAYTTDASGLYASRLQLKNPDEHMVLPEIISKEPLGPAVRQGDFQWFTIVKWVHFALLNAEELGVTKANVDEMLNSGNPDVRRLLGKEGDHGKGLGLNTDWAARIIKQVGNYGEIFEKNVGLGSRLKIERNLNALWNKGGLQYAPPIR